MENVPGAQRKAHQLPRDVTLPTASLPACTLRPGPRAATTTMNSALYKDRLNRASRGKSLIAQMLPVSLEELWLQATKRQLKLLTLPSQSPIRQNEIQKPSC